MFQIAGTSRSLEATSLGASRVLLFDTKRVIACSSRLRPVRDRGPDAGREHRRLRLERRANA